MPAGDSTKESPVFLHIKYNPTSIIFFKFSILYALAQLVIGINCGLMLMSSLTMFEMTVMENIVTICLLFTLPPRQQTLIKHKY